MKRVFAVAVCGFVALAVGCSSSTKSDASAGMVGDKKACCTEGGTCTDAAKANKAAPGMVGAKKDGCCSGSAASAGECPAQKSN